MNFLGHNEFGLNYKSWHLPEEYNDPFTLNHWLEQWYLTYEWCINVCSGNNNFHFVCYESLCQSEQVWFEIIDLIDVKEKYEFSFRQSLKEISLLAYVPRIELINKLKFNFITFFK